MASPSLCGWHTSLLHRELCQGRCSLLLRTFGHGIHPSLQASLPTSHGSPLAQHHSALYPRKCGLISQLWVNKPNLQQALRARIRKQLRPLRGQGQFKKLFARFSYCCAGSSCFPSFLRGGKKSQNQFVSVTCGDPEHPVLVLGAGEGRNCFQQPGGVGGRRALCAAGGCSVHASLLNKYLFKRV